MCQSALKQTDDIIQLDDKKWMSYGIFTKKFNRNCIQSLFSCVKKKNAPIKEKT